MKLISWNVNGLRSCAAKGFMDSFQTLDADVFCLQETKLQPGQIDLDMPGYVQHFHSAEKKGYSGTALFARVPIRSISFGLGIDEFDHEGRVITAEFDDFTLVNCYTPNSQDELKRLSFRMRWEDAMRAYLTRLNENKPVVLCGDLNVAHKPIDLKNPSPNRRNAGFTDEERGKMTELLDAGFIDTFRHFYPDKAAVYSWWSYIGGARSRNAGWRIDYFVASKKLENTLKSASIHQEVMGSDHCPVELVL